MLIVKMAWRNVWRNYRRSGITIAAMTLALVVELLYSGLVTGLVSGMENDATGYELGDLQVFKQGYLTRPSIYDVVDDDDALVSKLGEAGFPATSRLFGGGLGATGELSAGIVLMGVDPVQDAIASDLHKAVAEGEWLDNTDAEGVLVGRGLARTLALGLGDEIIVLSQATDGSMANGLFRVRGILMTVAAGLDRSGVVLTEPAFRELMALPDGAHRIIVRKPLRSDLSEALATVRGIVGPAAELGPDDEGAIDVMTWKQINPFLAQYIDSIQGIIMVLYFIVYIAVAILILNAMLMAVFERIREFGVLKAIGYGPSQILGMMLIEAMVQACVATALGLAIAAPAMWYLQVYGVNVGAIGGMQAGGLTMPAIWKANYEVATAQVPIIMLFVITLAATLYPAMKAAWIRPIEAMHHQ